MDAAGMSDAQQALLQQYLFDHQQQQQLIQLQDAANSGQGSPLDLLAAAGMGHNLGGFLGLSGSDMGPGGYDPLLGSSPAFTDEDRAMMRAGAGPKPNNHLYKTELCRNWEKMGTCPYGVKCQFAHGGHELRPSLKSRYRHEICRSFAVNGTCRFGARCRFLHVGPGSGLELLPEPSPLEMAAAAAAGAAGGGGFQMGWGGGGGSPGGGGGGVEADTWAALLAAGVDPAQLAAAGLFNAPMNAPPGLDHHTSFPSPHHLHHAHQQQQQQQHMAPAGATSPAHHHRHLPGMGSPAHQGTPPVGAHMRHVPAAASLLGTPDRGMLSGGGGGGGGSSGGGGGGGGGGSSGGGGGGGGGGGAQGLGPSAFMAHAAAGGRGGGGGGGGGYGGVSSSSRNLLGALSQRSGALSDVLSPMQPAGSLRAAGSGLGGMGGMSSLGGGGSGSGGGGGSGGMGWLPVRDDIMQSMAHMMAPAGGGGSGSGSGAGNSGGVEGGGSRATDAAQFLQHHQQQQQNPYEGSSPQGGQEVGLPEVGALLGAGIPLQDALAFLQQQQWQLLAASGAMSSSTGSGSSQAFDVVGSGDAGSAGVSGEMLGWGDAPAGNFPPGGSPGAGEFLVMSTPMKVAPHTPPNAGRGAHSSLGHAAAMFPQPDAQPQQQGWGLPGGGVNVSESSSAVSAPGQQAAAAAASTSPTTTSSLGNTSQGSPAFNPPGAAVSGGGGGGGGGGGYMVFSPSVGVVKGAMGEGGIGGASAVHMAGSKVESSMGGAAAAPASPPAADANSEMLTEGMLQLLTPMKLTS